MAGLSETRVFPGGDPCCLFLKAALCQWEWRGAECCSLDAGDGHVRATRQFDSLYVEVCLNLSATLFWRQRITHSLLRMKPRHWSSLPPPFPGHLLWGTAACPGFLCMRQSPGLESSPWIFTWLALSQLQMSVPLRALTATCSPGPLPMTSFKAPRPCTAPQLLCRPWTPGSRECPGPPQVLSQDMLKEISNEE